MTDTALAFENAQGYGQNATGGRGGQIVHVTNLNDTGTGSLRWALETVTGPRTIVFDVNGSITLASQILVRNGDVTIAGQSAAGGGITIEGSRIRIDASNVIVRGLHFRPGDGAVGQNPDDRDGMFIGSTKNVLSDIVIDHNSFEWSIDENVSATGSVRNITFSNNIIAQGLSNSLHAKGEHSKGTGTGNWTTGDYDANNHITWYGNLLADNSFRNPEIGTGDAIEFINNYVFNYGDAQYAAQIGGADANQTAKVAMVGNVFEAGLDTVARSRGPIYIAKLGTGSTVFLDDNLVVGRATDANGNQVQSTTAWSSYGSTKYITSTETFASNTNVLDSQQVVSYVLANAGAGGTYGRDSVDVALIAGVANKTSRIVDSVAEAGGPAINPAAAAIKDTDKDGMADWFEDLYGFNAKVADGAGDKDGDGYTNVEEYLNGIYDGFHLPQTKAATTVAHNAAGALVLGASLDSVRVVTGFNSAGGERLNLSAILAANPNATVQVTTAQNNTYVTVDADGSGTAAAARVVAILSGVQLTSVGDVVAGSVMTEAPGFVQPVVGVVSPVPVTGGVVVVTSTAPDRTPTLNDAGTTLPTGVTYSKGVVFAGVDYAMAPLLTSLTATGSKSIRIVGNALDNLINANAAGDILEGGAGKDRLNGGAGNDVLYGGDGNDMLTGGAGMNKLVGGLGDDSYIVSSAHDTIVEKAGEGYDTVSASVSFAIGENVEALTLTGAATNGTGNAMDNKITGNAADNALWGLGGADQISGGAGDDVLYGGDGNDRLDGGVGDDTMDGGLGDDVFFVDSTDDIVIERAGQGTDTVNASVSYTLSDNVEQLTLSGTTAIDGTGNALANKIIGNAADNAIYGMAGDDTLTGLAGNDKLYGGAGSDRLDGGVGNDVISGGAGLDYLTGGAGNDVFHFARGDSTLVATTMDQVLDFTRGQDVIDLDVVNGSLAPGAFATGYAAAGTYAAALQTATSLMAGGDKKAVFVAGKGDGWLFWDTDGNAATPDQAILLKGMGFANAAAFNAGTPFDVNWLV